METCNDSRALVSLTVLTALIKQLEATKLLNVDALTLELSTASLAFEIMGQTDNRNALANYLDLLKQR
jgi:hypothetical protein